VKTNQSERKESKMEKLTIPIIERKTKLLEMCQK